MKLYEKNKIHKGMVYVYMNENFILDRQGSDVSQNLKRCLLLGIVMRKQLREDIKIEEIVDL